VIVNACRFRTAALRTAFDTRPLPRRSAQTSVCLFSDPRGGNPSAAKSSLAPHMKKTLSATPPASFHG